MHYYILSLIIAGVLVLPSCEHSSESRRAGPHELPPDKRADKTTSTHTATTASTVNAQTHPTVEPNSTSPASQPKTPSAQVASNPKKYEIHNSETYGNCIVESQLYKLKAKTSHLLTCYEVEAQAALIMRVDITKNQKLEKFYSTSVFAGSLELSDEKSFDPEVKYKIVFQVDSNPVISHPRGSTTATMIMGDLGYVFYTKETQFLRLLNQLPRAHKIKLKVHNQESSLLLKGTAAAVADFKSRWQ